MKRILASLLLLFLFASPAHGFKKETYFHLTLPVRHLEPSPLAPQSTLDLPVSVYNIATHSGTPLSWLLEYDVVASSTDSSYFAHLAKQPNQDVGLLLEITKQLQIDSGVSPRFGSGFYSPSRFNLLGYPTDERERLLDTLFAAYFERFHRYPSVIAADYIDSASLSYISSKYPVELALFSVFPDPTYTSPPVDQNLRPRQITPPLPWSVYYPSRFNSLIPSASSQTKVNIPVAFYNPPLPGSDQPLNWQQIDALSSSNSLATIFDPLSLKSLNEFTQITLGTDNSAPLSQALPTFKRLLQFLSSHREQYTLQPQTLSRFGLTFKGRYPFTSPAYFFQSQDKTKAYYTNPFYQAELTTDSAVKISRLTVFNDLQSETYRHTPLPLETLVLENASIVTPDQPIDLHQDSLTYTNEYWDLVATSSSQTLRFEPKKIILPPASEPLPTTPVLTRDWFNSRLYHINPNRFPFSPLPTISLLVIIALGLFALLAKRIFNLSSIVLFTLLFITLVMLTTIMSSGTFTQYGLSFWGAHEHDSLFHLSIVNSLKNSLSLTHPTLINSTISNYHLGFDLLLAVVAKVTTLSPLDLYFRVLPSLLIFALALSVYLLTRRLRLSPAASLLALFLTFFTGSLGFIKGLPLGDWFSGESVFWSMQPVSMLLNPPFALSLLLLTFYFYLDANSSRASTIARIIIFALLLQTKTYAFILLGLALGLRFLLNLYRRRLTGLKQETLILALGSLLAFISVLPTHKLGRDFFILKPLWFPQTMVTTLDRFSWPQAANALFAYSQYQQSLKLFVLLIFLTLIFLVGNFGIRLLGLLYLKHSQNQTQKLIWLLILSGTIIPLLFIQTGNPWNTIQFLYYPLFYSSLFLAPVIIEILAKTKNLFQVIIISLALFLLALPTTIGTLKNYLSPSPSTAIPYEEVLALDYLSRLPSGLVLSPYPSQFTYRFYGPSPLFNFVSTAYVSALSGQPSVFADDINLEIMGYDYREVKKDTQQFFTTTDLSTGIDLLCRLNVRYVYQPTHTRLALDPLLLGLKPVFKNPLINLYQFSYEDICRR